MYEFEYFIFSLRLPRKDGLYIVVNHPPPVVVWLQSCSILMVHEIPIRGEITVTNIQEIVLFHYISRNCPTGLSEHEIAT